MKDINIKKLVIKAAVTFIQAAVAALVISDGLDKAAIAGAIGTALSLVWNTTLYPALQDYLNS